MGSTGFGNCQKFPPIGPIKGKPFCYVEQPSGCSDVRESTSDPGEKYSAEACVLNSGGNIEMHF